MAGLASALGLCRPNEGQGPTACRSLTTYLSAQANTVTRLRRRARVLGGSRGLARNVKSET